MPGENIRRVLIHQLVRQAAPFLLRWCQKTAIFRTGFVDVAFAAQGLESVRIERVLARLAL